MSLAIQPWEAFLRLCDKYHFYDQQHVNEVRPLPRPDLLPGRLQRQIPAGLRFGPASCGAAPGL